MSGTRRQMNVRLDPDLIARVDAKRAMLGTSGLSRDRYVEQVLLADLDTPPPDPAQLAAEAAALAARIHGD